ncbi:MAG TPA: hypothetical protein VMV49_16775, partial [Candidatus Deferrimicrobium sp.]|nr:hypothetical protein [Candidatus Deferrimicrobium sp.]
MAKSKKKKTETTVTKKPEPKVAPEVKAEPEPKKEEPEVKAEPEPKKEEISEKALDNLNVAVLDGVGSVIEGKLIKIGIKTVEDLAFSDSVEGASKIEIPIHRFMEYRKKAQMILRLYFDEATITTLADKNYTIEQTIEEKPEVLQQITKLSKQDIEAFLEKLIEITMYLDAAICRTSSIAILHRLKPEEKKPVPPPKGGISAEALELLSTEALDGVGSTIETKLKKAGVTTIQDLSNVDIAGLPSQVKLPSHKLMEYQKKAQLILDLYFDEEMIDALAAKNYTIEQAIEENPDVLQGITGKSADEVKSFLEKLIQVTIYLDAATCRTNSIAILHRLKPKAVKRPPTKKVVSDGTLATLSIAAIDGVGPIIEADLNKVGIETIEQLSDAEPSALYSETKLPLHKFMEYQKKAQQTLGLEFDKDIIDALVAKNYTIEQAIEEAPNELKNITKKDTPQIISFLEKLVEITMFLDAETCRTRSIGILRSSKAYRIISKEQILAIIYDNQVGRAILDILHEKALTKKELFNQLEALLVQTKTKEKDFDYLLDLFIKVEIVQLEWINYDLYIFLIADYIMLRRPAEKIYLEAQDGIPSPMIT